MSDNILEDIYGLCEIYEVNTKPIKERVIRAGEVKIVTECPDGYIFSKEQNRCVKMTAAEIIKFARAAKKRARTMARKSGSSKMMSERKRTKSMTKHERFQAKMGEVPISTRR